MRKKLILLFAALLACVVLFTSCSKNVSYLMESSPVEVTEPAYDAEEATDDGVVFSSPPAVAYAPPPNGIADTADYNYTTTAVANGSAEPVPAAAAGRKLVKNITAEIETLDFEAYLNAVEAKTAALGGHIHSKQTGDYGYYQENVKPSRQASLMLRIPAQALDELKGSLGNLGRVTSLNESVRDETLSYNDTAAHIEALKVERDALIKLMGNAKDLKDLIMLQERVTDVQRQLNSLEGALRLLDDQVALSTVTLTIKEVRELTPEPEPEPEPEGYLARTWTGFKNSVRSIVKGIGEFLSGLVIALPWLVVIGLPAAAVVFVLLRRRKKRKAEK